MNLIKNELFYKSIVFIKKKKTVDVILITILQQVIKLWTLNSTKNYNFFNLSHN